MNIALDWIADYLDAPVDAQAAEDALVNAGLPVESNEPHGATRVLDVEVTSNRSDCLCHVGLARELAVLLRRNFRAPQIAVRATGPDVHSLASVEIADPAACPYYSARVIQGVKVGPSPEWLIHRLEAIGLRPVNNVVDVTNYVMMELGQPLHTFDYDTLAKTGGRAKIIVRRAKPGTSAAAATGEKMLAIDGKTYTLDASMLVIADAGKPIAIAGVMGGKETEVTNTTRNILLESARFDPLVVRAQARALSLMSDSSYRFERGIDPLAAEMASVRAAQLICELAGGTVADGVVTAGQATFQPLEVTLRLARIAAVLGIEVPTDKALAILSALGFAPELSPDVAGNPLIRCRVPAHRLDVTREIDLIEEIARIYGYAHVVAHDRVTHSVQAETPAERARRIIRQAFLAAGFNETITVTFVDESEAQAFLPASMGGKPAPALIRVSDAVRKASNVLRPSLLPSLLQVRRTNQNAGIPDARLFEHAQIFWQTDQDAPSERSAVALVGADVSEVRGAIELVIERLRSGAALVALPRDYPWYTPGISASLAIHTKGQDHPLGHFGQFSAEVQKRYDLRHPLAGAELNWPVLAGALEAVRQSKPLPRFPGVRRDLSIVVSDAVRWAEIAAVLKDLKLEALAAIDFVGTFRNKQIGSGKKSLTLTLEFRDPNTTLRSEQVDTQVKSALEHLATKFGAVLRT